MASNKSKLNRMSPGAKSSLLGDKLDAIITLLNELKGDLDALRVDFRKHDHGAAYTAATLRINAGVDTITGTETSSAVASSAVSALN